MSIKLAINLITLVLVSIVILASWSKIQEAYMLLGQVNLWILSLLIPLQIASYYTAGSILFSYLRSKGLLTNIRRWTMARISVEFNFINHVLPSGGAVGFSYLTFILSKFGVSPAKSTMGQLIRYVLTFLSFVVLLLFSVLVLVVDAEINRLIVILTSAMVAGALILTGSVIFVFKDSRRMNKVSGWIRSLVNGTARKLTRGRRTELIKKKAIDDFFEEIHQDYLALRREKKLLLRPFSWAVVNNILDVSLIGVAFWALGSPINPALLVIAYCVSSVASVLSILPGGAGIYEAAMITLLTSAGINAEVAIAGTLLARVVLLIGTIVTGYVFYQNTVSKYGKEFNKRK